MKPVDLRDRIRNGKIHKKKNGTIIIVRQISKLKWNEVDYVGTKKDFNRKVRVVVRWGPTKGSIIKFQMRWLDDVKAVAERNQYYS